jgi:D-serine ammonia-lyase (EC 4.3.1.18)
LREWVRGQPLVDPLVGYRETQWFNPGLRPTAEAIGEVGLDRGDIEDAAARLKRFAPYMAAVFPDTRRTQGILESPLVAAPTMKAVLGRGAGRELLGDLWIKLDSELPVSGSIKARGGIYEVLRHAEDLAVDAGMLSLDDDHAVLASPEFTEFFSRHAVAVGSTGNLGLSIGIMSAKLGFRATVHMSADARQWKKDKLRANGVEVLEYESDYSEAVRAGRARAEEDPTCYFVDDENSRNLFLGYAVAAHRLAGQLQALDVTVDRDHPLFVHLPCGVGGGPGVSPSVCARSSGTTSTSSSPSRRTARACSSASSRASMTGCRCRTSGSTMSPRRMVWPAGGHPGSSARRWSTSSTGS